MITINTYPGGTHEYRRPYYQTKEKMPVYDADELASALFNICVGPTVALRTDFFIKRRDEAYSNA